MISGYLLYPIIPLLTTIKCKYDHIRLFTHSVFILIHLGTSVILISYSSILKAVSVSTLQITQQIPGCLDA